MYAFAFLFLWMHTLNHALKNLPLAEERHKRELGGLEEKE